MVSTVKIKPRLSSLNADEQYDSITTSNHLLYDKHAHTLTNKQTATQRNLKSNELFERPMQAIQHIGSAYMLQMINKTFQASLMVVK